MQARLGDRGRRAGAGGRAGVLSLRLGSSSALGVSPARVRKDSVWCGLGVFRIPVGICLLAWWVQGCGMGETEVSLAWGGDAAAGWTLPDLLVLVTPLTQGSSVLSEGSLLPREVGSPERG